MRRTLFALPITTCLLLAACGGVPSFPPPPQQEFPPPPPPGPRPIYIPMNAPDAPAAFVRDIQDYLEGTGWRWTHQRPELRILVDNTQNLKLRWEFSFPEPNFKDTGPVTVTFLVNGNQLDQVQYTTPGDKLFEKRVPAAWLRAHEYARAGAVVAPPWVAPGDKTALGFVLYGAGFVE